MEGRAAKMVSVRVRTRRNIPQYRVCVLVCRAMDYAHQMRSRIANLLHAADTALRNNEQRRMQQPIVAREQPEPVVRLFHENSRAILHGRQQETTACNCIQVLEHTRRGVLQARRDRRPPWISWKPTLASLGLEDDSVTPGLRSCLFIGRKPRPMVLWRDPHRLIEMVRYIAMNWRFRLYSIMMYLLFDDLTRVRVSHDLGGDRAPAITFSLPLLRLLRLNPNVKK